MQQQNQSSANANEIKCINCGGTLTFNPGVQMLKCQYCSAENEIIVDKEANVEEQDFHKFIEGLENEAEKEQVNTVSCNACGATTTFDENVVADSCPFCDTQLVATEGTTKDIIRPQSLLPFKIETSTAHAMFKTWIKKRWFAPSKLKKYARQEEKLAGIYIPYWTYDSNTTTDYSGQRGDDYQENETYQTTDDEGNSVQETRTVTKTRWTSVRGTVTQFFNDVLVLASRSLPKKKTDKLEPWDLENLVPFDSSYLSGFKAESYQVSLEEGFKEAKARMEKKIREKIKRDIGGDHQQIHSVKTGYNNLTFKHLLLPVWLSSYRFKNKVYQFMVNGRTGEVQGERPYSALKIILTILLGLAILGGGGYLIYEYAIK